MRKKLLKALSKLKANDDETQDFPSSDSSCIDVCTGSIITQEREDLINASSLFQQSDNNLKTNFYILLLWETFANYLLDFLWRR